MMCASIAMMGSTEYFYYRNHCETKSLAVSESGIRKRASECNVRVQIQEKEAGVGEDSEIESSRDEVNKNDG